MLIKSRYTTLNENIPLYRGVLHGLFFPYWLKNKQYTLALNYLMSFIFHKTDIIDEHWTRFLDHVLIALRILTYPEPYPKYTKERIMHLIWFMIGAYICWIRNYNVHTYYKLIQKWMIAYVLMAVYLSPNSEKSKMAKNAFPYLVPATLWFLEYKFPWHSEIIWTYHEDFHLLLLIVDLWTVHIAKPWLFINMENK